MKDIKNWIWQGITVLLLIAIALFAGRKTVDRIENVYDTIRIVDTVWYAHEIEVPVPYKVIEHDTIILYDTIKFKVPVPTDTAGILADYVRYFVYSDTLHFKDLNLTIEEVLSRNRIEHRAISYQNLRETQIITATNQLSGLFVGADLSLNSFTPEVSLIRDGWEYSAGFQFDFNRNHSLQIGVKKQIWRPSTPRN